MKMKNKFIIVCMCFGLMACSAAKQISTYTIASKTTIGYGVGPMNCMLVKEGDGENWNLFYSQIEGFSYEPGYEYVLQVRKEKIDNPPADGSSIRYRLVKVVSKTQKESEGLPGLD